MDEKKYYLTAKGFEKLKREAETLRELKSAKINGEVPEILQSEDLNPEYLSFQEDLSLLEARMADLEYIIKNAQIIKTPEKNGQHIISLGATVVTEVDGQTDEFEVVGSLEANPAIGMISNESPIGRALLGHKIGDEVVVSSPLKTTFKIKKITYRLS